MLTYRYRPDLGGWQPEWRLVAEDEAHSRLFGAGAVEVQGPVVMVGTPDFLDENGASSGAVHAFDPTLGLEAGTTRAKVGDPVAVKTCRGLPGAPVLLFIVGFDDQDLFFRIDRGVIDAHGEWTHTTASLPDELAGHDLFYQSFSFNDLARIQGSNVERLRVH